MNDEPGASSTEESEVQRACSALLELTAGRATVEAIVPQLVDRWWYAPDDALYDIVEHRARAPFRTRRQVTFLFAERLAADAYEDSDREDLRAAIPVLASAMWQVAHSDEHTEQGRGAAALAVRELLQLARHPHHSAILKGIRAMAPDVAMQEGLPEVLGVSWTELQSILRHLRAGLVVREAEEFLPPPLGNVADSVLAGGRRAAPAATVPTYDNTDAERRVVAVALTGCCPAVTVSTWAAFTLITVDRRAVAVHAHRVAVRPQAVGITRR